MRAALLLLLTIPAAAQFQILPTPTSADLRGIHAVSPEIAWASGTNGTVLRTTDAGAHWTLCPTPPNAEHLDFRGIQAFDAQTAIVMSSGKGDLSRLYKTTDACATWTLLFTNPDPEGFWDAIWAFHKSPRPVVSLIDSPHWMEWSDTAAVILGDPVNKKFVLLGFDPTGTGPRSTLREWAHLPHAMKEEAGFAASNSAIYRGVCALWIASGGKSGSRIFEHVGGYSFFDRDVDTFRSVSVPIGTHTASSGIFSFVLLPDAPKSGYRTCDSVGVAVGGDYLRPDDSSRTTAFTTDGGKMWQQSQTPPHGYRSSVAYSPDHKTWITVGPNGTDISTDDGRNWHPLPPNPQAGDPPDADKNWNALSLPYVVGPHGRIGKLRPTTLPHP